MNKEQLLEKMLENVRAGREVTKGLQKKRGDEWGKFYNNDVETCLFGPAEFRIKPRTRIICGFDVPAPEVGKPEAMTVYYGLHVLGDGGVEEYRWEGDKDDKSALRNGLWFSKDEAIANAKALRGENPYE